MKQHVPALLLAFCPHDSLPLLTPLSTSVLTLLSQSKGNMADLGAEILLPPPPIVFKNGLEVGEEGTYISRQYNKGKKIGHFKIAFLPELKESREVWMLYHWKC